MADLRSITSPENGKKGGREAGSKNARTKLREEVLQELKNHIYKSAKKILNAQSIVAVGTHKMVQMLKGPGDAIIPRTIRDEEEMQNLLDDGVYGVDYVIVMGREPDFRAGDAVLNRAFGKPKETVEIMNPVITEEEKVKTGEDAIADYLQGKRGFTMPESMRTENKDVKENFRTNIT